MKRLFKNLLIISLPVILVLYLLNYIADTGLKRSGMPTFAEWNDIYTSRVNADLIIMGASRVEKMVSPFILDSVLGVSCFNLGIDGWCFNMQYAKFQIYMQHNTKPRYVVQGVDLMALTDNWGILFNDQFIPYLHDTIIENITDQYIGHFSLAEKYIPLFKYNNKFGLLQNGIAGYFSKNIEVSHKGYYPLQHDWDSSFINFKRQNPDGVHKVIPEKIIRRFNDYLSYCSQNNIKVIFEFAPVYYEELLMEKDDAKIRKIFTDLSVKYNIPFLDYTRDSLCYNKKYFYNSQHLNKIGAEIFSRHLAMDIKAIIGHVN
jgi:hypothetical protein